MIFNITCTQVSSPNLYTLLSFFALIICTLLSFKIYKEIKLDEKINFFMTLIWIYPFFLLGSKFISFFYYQGFHIPTIEQLIHSGMSLHGALLLTLIPIFLLKIFYQLSPMKLGSVLLTPLGVGIFFIRIANTFNCELLGLNSGENDFIKILYIGKSLSPKFPIQVFEGVIFLIISIVFIYFRKILIPKNLPVKLFFISFPLIRIVTDRFKSTPENLIENSSLLKSDYLSLIFLLIALTLIVIDRKTSESNTH